MIEHTRQYFVSDSSVAWSHLRPPIATCIGHVPFYSIPAYGSKYFFYPVGVLTTINSPHACFLKQNVGALLNPMLAWESAWSRRTSTSSGR